jgi:hypothetical protein
MNMVMRFLALFLLLFTSVSACAEHELTGLWEGYSLTGEIYGSQISEIDKNVKFKNGYIEVNIHHPSGHHSLILAQDLGSKLNVLTIFTGLNQKPFFSIPWALTRVGDNLRNKSLYDFAKNYL